MNQAPATSAIRSISIGDFADALASKAPAPGGGAVAPIVGALAASLGRMVLAYTTGKKKYAEHATLHERSGETLATLGVVAMELADADAEAYGRLDTLWGLAEDDERRRREWAGAVDAAIAAPAGVLGTSLSILHHLEPLVGTTNRNQTAKPTAARTRITSRIRILMAGRTGLECPNSGRKSSETQGS